MSRQAELRPLFEWRACYAPNFPRDVADRAGWLVQLLSVEGSQPGHTPKHLVEATRIFRKLRDDERLRLCQKFFAERAARLSTFTVLYRHGGLLCALRQEAPSADDAAYAVSASVGHKCFVIAVMDGRAEIFAEGDLPQVFCFWNNAQCCVEVFAWRDVHEQRTRKIKALP